MKRKLLAAMLSGSMLLSLFSVPAAAAADPAPLSRQRDAVTYYATSVEEIRHICDMVMAGDHVVVAGNLTVDLPLILDHASLTIEEGSTLTLAAGILVEGDSSIRGGGIIQREASNSGALITVADGASLLLEDVTIDGGARWSECDETDPISATLLRGTTNSGLTATAPLILSCGDLTVKNAVLQNNENTSPGNNAEDSGTSAIFTYGNASLTLDNATVRNNKANAVHGSAVTGRSATTTITINGGEYYGNAGNSGGFFTWGKLYLNSGTIRNNYADQDMGGGIRVAGGATLYMNGGTVTQNMTDSFGAGITLYSATGYFNGGTVSENTQKGPSHSGFAGGGGLLLYGGKAVLDGTDFIDNTAVEGGGISMNSSPTLTINAGRISGNHADKGGGLRYYSGTITLNGGTITDNSAQLGGGIYAAPSNASKLIIKASDVSNNSDTNGSSDIFYDCESKINNQEVTDFFTLLMDLNVTPSSVVTNKVPNIAGKTCTTGAYAGCRLSQFVPQKPGFTFAYWATEDGTEFKDDTVINGDMALYAHWYCAGEHDLTVTQVDATRTVTCTRCDYVSTTELVVVSDYTGVFDGQPHTVTLSAPADVNVTWYSDAAHTTSYSEQPNFTNAGTYTVYYEAVGSDPSSKNPGTAKVTITPLNLGSWDQKRVYSYDGTEKSPYSDKLSTYFEVTGTTHATEPGEYLMTCTLKSEYDRNVTWSVADDQSGKNHTWTCPPADYSPAGTYPKGSVTSTMILVWAIEGSSKAPVTLSFAEPTISKEISDFTTPQTFTNSLTGVPENGTVSYTSSKPHVAEVNTNGAVTLHCVGNALITAQYAGDDDHEAASASYVITVTSNTEENHATVDDPAVPPNCVEDGHTAGKVCRVCGKTWESTVIPATGHTPAEAVQENVVEATDYAPGSYDNVIYCSVCDTKLSSTTVVIPQLTPVPDPEPSYDDSDDDYYEPSVVITDPAGGSATVNGRTVKLLPAEGYEIKKITVNGKQVAIPKDGVLTRVRSGAKVVVTFSKTEVPAPSGVYETPFVDVAGDAYYSEAVRWADETGVTTGIDATHFAPHWSVTRAQAVTFLWRAAGRPTPHGGPSVFGDVEPGSYYETAVAWAHEQRITKGTSATTFSPNMICTRAQIVTLLARYSGVQDADSETNYSDVAANDYFAAAVKWADETNVTYGMGNGLFCPHTDCTRGQIVTFLWRMAK